MSLLRNKMQRDAPHFLKAVFKTLAEGENCRAMTRIGEAN